MIREEHRESNWQFPFVSYTNRLTDSPLPLIIQLHGAGERGEGRDDLSLVDINGFSKLVKNDESHECMIVMPQCPSDSFWAAKVESIVAFAEQIIKTYNIDESRVYLTGLSMGGFGTWFTALARPDLFAAIAPVCGGGMSWLAGVLNMPIWVFHGVVDPTVPVAYSDIMVEALKKGRKNVKYTRLEGVAHNAWDHTYDSELLEWLLSQKKN